MLTRTVDRGLNLETSDGREIFKRLVKTAHFVVESFEPGYMADLGLGYADLEAINPALVMTSITPYGQEGPYALDKAQDINLQAIRHLAPGGLLATFSCSNFMEEDLFGKIVQGAARDAQADLQLLARLEAGPDHPLAAGHPEGRYLKGLLLRKPA